MAPFLSPTFCWFCFSLLLLFCCSHLCRAQTVATAMYVFGDSIVDFGNNHYMPLSIIKADFPHNGIDYPGRKATGRFSNGKNAADFLAEKLGLISPPPYLSGPNNTFPNGVSFASGGAGILNTTYGGYMQTITMAQQVGYFSMVRQRLAKEMGSTAVQKHLSKSIFPIIIGSNDIIIYFNTGLQKKIAPQQYVTLMVTTLNQLLKETYGLGARKFLLIGLSPIGCAPEQRRKNKNNECNNKVNYWSKRYNKGLTRMLPQLQSKLKDFHYTYFDTYSVFTDFIENAKNYGFTEVKGACCGNGKLRAKLPCTPLARYCSDRSSHLFWDIYHPTEAAAKTFIAKLFNGSRDYVFPITLPQLLAL